jgi:hypothetical protein
MILFFALWIIDAPGMLAELIRWLGGLDEQFPAV